LIFFVVYGGFRLAENNRKLTYIRCVWH